MLTGGMCCCHAVFLMVITFNLLVLCQHQQIVECSAATGCPRNGSIQPFYAQVRLDKECSSAMLPKRLNRSAHRVACVRFTLCGISEVMTSVKVRSTSRVKVRSTSRALLHMLFLVCA
jgi:hypothetical protein